LREGLHRSQLTGALGADALGTGALGAVFGAEYRPGMV